MAPNEPHDHHYAPQFYLRNFACDEEKKKINAVMKHGSRAVWAQRSIKSIGFEHDLYVHMNRGTPVSVEGAVNRHVETPISESDTWAKIASGQSAALDRSDKPVLYALIRHLQARTPHALATFERLTQIAASPDSDIRFTDEEREMYAEFRADPTLTKAMFSHMSSSLDWTEQSYRGACLSILRSPVPFRTSTTPVVSISALEHPALWMPLPDMTPHHLGLALNKTTFAMLILADFDDAFSNREIDVDVARGLNRHIVGHFAFFEQFRHLISDRDGLVEEMTWAPYRLVEESERKIVFQRKP